ncbi:MAG: tetratricopeptide repeat protein [Coriobacteriia bacterium]|nr:tetratricopeptide repeat protein [Coriobacteriia bacterium]
MDQSRFQEAQSAYDTGDYRTAAKGFLAAAGKTPAGSGSAYHMAGNALMRLRRYQDAVTVYGHALRDDMYDRRGVVHGNLGQAWACQGEYAESERAYRAALEEPDYRTPWKAWQGVASALLERGRVEDAASAYRKAAIDSENPEPAKALVNLGLCFMALARPADAAEAYKAALGFENYPGRGKALANLGIAYTQMGEYDEAVRAFERASQLHSHKLSAPAQQAYDAALSMVRPASAKVEGWETGDLVVTGAPMAPSGWATGELDALGSDLQSGAGTFAPAELEPAAAGAAPMDGDAGFGDEESVQDFFRMTEAEMKVRDREERRARRSEGGAAGMFRRYAWIGVAIVLLVGALGGAYWLGFGWPTQESTVGGMLDTYRQGGDVSVYWVAVTDKDVDKEMAKVPPQVKSFTIDSMKRAAETSVAFVSITPDKGAPLHYRITLSREGVGWRVDGIDNDWRSTGGG